MLESIKETGWKSWLLSALFLILLATSGWSWNNLWQHMFVLDTSDKTHGEKIAMHEAKILALEKDQTEIKNGVNLLIRMHLKPDAAREQ